MDSRAAIKAALKAELMGVATDTQGTVVCLAGPWGSGKTHIWREVASELRAPERRTAYVSLFGLVSIAEAKAAIVNDTILADTRDEGALKRAYAWTTKQLPGVLQALDKKIGFELLSRNLDLSYLLPKGTIVCLDDLERLSDHVKIEDVLGLAGLLAEQRGARVLLIMNDAHLEERHPTYNVLLRAYRERVVRLSLKLEPDLGAVRDKLQAAKIESLTPENKDGALAAMTRAKSANLRTLSRIMEHASKVAAALRGAPSAEQMAFLGALTIEDSEGALKDEKFYAFDPTYLFFLDSDPAEKQGRLEDLVSTRISFHRRHFGPGITYRYSKALHDLVAKGYIDTHALRREVDALQRPSIGAAQAVLEPWANQSCFYFSDAENCAWLKRIEQLLSSDNSLSAVQSVECLSAAGMASEQAGIDVPPVLMQLGEAALLTAGRRGDDSFGRAARMGSGRHVPQPFVAAYDAALEESNRNARALGLIQCVWDADLRAFCDAVRAEPPVSLQAALSSNVLEELHASRPGNRAFYFGALLELAKQCKDYASPSARVTFRKAINGALLMPGCDSSDRWRLHHVARMLGTDPPNDQSEAGGVDQT